MSPSPTPPKRLDCHGDIFQLQCGLRYRDAHHDSALHTCNCCNGTSSDKGKRKSLSTLLTLLCVWQKRRERDFKNRNIERKKVKFSFPLTGAQDVSGRRRKHAARSGRVDLRSVEERPGARSRVQRCCPHSPGSQFAPVPYFSAQLPWQQSLVVAWSGLWVETDN